MIIIHLKIGMEYLNPCSHRIIRYCRFH